MTTLLVLLCQSTALLSLGFLALRLTQKRGPAVQTVVGRATFSSAALLLLLLPLSGRIAPVWRIPTPVRPSPALVAPQNLRAKREGAEVQPVRALRDALLTLPSAASAPPPVSVPAAPPTAAGTAIQESANTIEGANTAEGAASPEGAASSAPTLPAALPTPRPPASGGPLRSNLLQSKEVGLPTLLLFFWLAVCRWHLFRLRRAAHPVADGPAAALLAELTPRPPLLLTHPSVHSPFLAGTRRPAIFLPPSFAADFAPDALRAVFLHELAHRDRRDNLWTLAARLLTAALWFQPLLWLLCRKMEQISEDACDEAVLAADCPPRAYAACLLSLAERPPLARHQRTLTAGVAPFRSSIGRRISRILTRGVPPMPAVTLRLRLTIAALTVAAALGGAFLVSSAPAQTQPKPAPAATPEMLKFHAERVQDLANLKAIGMALIQYEQGHHERYPSALHWMDQITPYLPDRSVLFNPFQPGEHRYGYAFNRNCSQKSLSAFDAPAATIAVYESTLGTRNANDTGQSVLSHSVRSPGEDYTLTGTGYGFADGHAKWLRADVHPSFLLVGDPPSALFGVWLRPFSGGENSAMILKPDGSYEDISPRHVGIYNGLVHQYGRYEAHSGKLVYVLTRGWEEDAKPFSFPPETHDMDYTLSGNTLTVGKKGKYENVSHRVPYYAAALIHLKPSTLSARALELQQLVAADRLKAQRMASATTGGTLGQAQFLAGLTPVQGPGVVVTLRDSAKPFTFPKGVPAGMTPPNVIHDTDINQVVNELKAAGAEAITVNNQRLVATSAVRCAGPTVYVNNTPQAPPYIIQAIGDPKTLAGALNMPGGIATQITAYDKAMFSVQEAATLTLPAYAGKGEMRYAKPVSAPDFVQSKLDFLRRTQIEARQHSPTRREQVVITLDSRAAYFLDDVQLPEAQIEPFLAARARQNSNITAVIEADRDQSYSRVEHLLDLAKQAGIRKIAIAPPTPGGTQSVSNSETTPATARTHTIIGYGLVSFMLSKHLYCRAVEHSEAARLGVPIEPNSEIIGVNGKPTPKTAAQFVEICRSAPPLRLLLKPVQLKNFTRKTQLVTFQTKMPFSVVTDAARAEEQGKGQKSAQADAAKAKATLVHTDQQLSAEVHVLIPQAAPATLTTALNLERRIGWSMHCMSFAKQYVAWGLRKHNPKSKLWAASLQASMHKYLRPETAEEAQIFPQTADSRRQLAQIHLLAEQMGGMRITVMGKQIQAMVIADLMRQRSPDTAL